MAQPPVGVKLLALLAAQRLGTILKAFRHAPAPVPFAALRESGFGSAISLIPDSISAISFQKSRLYGPAEWNSLLNVAGRIGGRAVPPPTDNGRLQTVQTRPLEQHQEER